MALNITPEQIREIALLVGEELHGVHPRMIGFYPKQLEALFAEFQKLQGQTQFCEGCNTLSNRNEKSYHEKYCRSI